jgi:hypothetical protein
MASVEKPETMSLGMKFGIDSTEKMVNHWLMHSNSETVMKVAESAGWKEGHSFEAKVTVNGVELPFKEFDDWLMKLYVRICQKTEEKYSNVEAEVQRRLAKRMKEEAEPIIEKMGNMMRAMEEADSFIKPYWEKTER